MSWNSIGCVKKNVIYSRNNNEFVKRKRNKMVMPDLQPREVKLTIEQRMVALGVELVVNAQVRR